MIFCQKSTKIYIHIMLCHADIISAGRSFTCLYRLSSASGLTGEWQYRDNIMFKTILKLIGSLFLLSPSKSSPTVIFETSTYTVIFEIFDFGDLEKFIIILSLCPFLALAPRAMREDTINKKREDDFIRTTAKCSAMPDLPEKGN